MLGLFGLRPADEKKGFKSNQYGIAKKNPQIDEEILLHLLRFLTNITTRIMLTMNRTAPVVECMMIHVKFSPEMI